MQATTQAGIQTAVGVAGFDFTSQPSAAKNLTGALYRQFRAFNRTETLDTFLGNQNNGNSSIAYILGSTSGTSGVLVGWTPHAAEWVIGGTAGSSFANSAAGILWPKHTGCCIPGVTNYHVAAWQVPLLVSFRFAIANIDMGSGCYIIGGYGGDSSDVPWQLNGGVLYGQGWLNGGSGITTANECRMGFMIKGDGTLSIYTCDGTGNPVSVNVTGTTVDTTAHSNPFMQELVFVTEGNGHVNVFLNPGPDVVYVGRFAGLRTTVGNADNYPFLVGFNEPSGTTVTNLDFQAYPMEVTAAIY